MMETVTDFIFLGSKITPDLFFTPVIFVYIRPATTLPEDKVFTLFYTQ